MRSAAPSLHVLLLALLTACASSSAGSRRAGEDAPATPPVAANAADAGSDSGTPEGRPFAGSAAEATSLISDAVDKKQSALKSCVRDFRTRKKIERARVSLSIGIDQEGKVLGVTSKGKEDVELKTCVQTALREAPFPRSHSGVITITKTYEEFVQ